MSHNRENPPVRKRTGKDIWENLYEFVLYETNELPEPGKKTVNRIVKDVMDKQVVSIKNISPIFRQQLTHQTITGQFIELEATAVPRTLKNYELVKTALLPNYPFPKFINAYLQQQSKPMQLF